MNSRSVSRSTPDWISPGARSRTLPSEKLPLFSEYAYDWLKQGAVCAADRQGARHPEEVPLDRGAIHVRQPFRCLTRAIATCSRSRGSARKDKQRVAVIGNMDFARDADVRDHTQTTTEDR